MRIALASFENLYDWEVDDRPLEAALRTSGAELAVEAWDDPAVDWSVFDACLIRTTWDYHQRAAEFLRWTEGPHQRLFNPAAVVRWNTDKRYLRALEGQGVACIPTVWIEPGVDVDAALATASEWGRAFLKPVVGANASQTLRFDPSDPAQVEQAADHTRALASSGGGMLQQYLDSVETVGEVSAIFVDGVFGHGVRKIPVPGDYRVQDDHGASDGPWRPSPQEKDQTRAAVEAAAAVLGPEVLTNKPLLYARADFLTDPEGNLVLTELELIEPSLFFRHGEATATALAEALLRRCR